MRFIILIAAMLRSHIRLGPRRASNLGFMEFLGWRLDVVFRRLFTTLLPQPLVAQDFARRVIASKVAFRRHQPVTVAA